MTTRPHATTFELTGAQCQDLHEAQTLGAELLRELKEALPHLSLQSFTMKEAESTLLRLATARNLQFAYRPRLSTQAPKPLQGFRPDQKITLPTLLSVDVSVKRGEVAGDLGRTLLLGDDGRNWFYHRIFERIVQGFQEGLGGCVTEADAWSLAKSCTEREGGKLLSPPRRLGHHVPVPHPQNALEASLRRRKEWLEHSLKAQVPAPLSKWVSPPLNRGLWSLELSVRLDRRDFFQEDLYVWQGDGLLRLGDRLALHHDV